RKRIRIISKRTVRLVAAGAGIHCLSFSDSTSSKGTTELVRFINPRFEPVKLERQSNNRKYLSILTIILKSMVNHQTSSNIKQCSLSENMVPSSAFKI
ncbi:hypothetical protein L9F63_006034, partial [Diploptera punctata]